MEALQKVQRKSSRMLQFPVQSSLSLVLLILTEQRFDGCEDDQTSLRGNFCADGFGSEGGIAGFDTSAKSNLVTSESSSFCSFMSFGGDVATALWAFISIDDV